MKYLNNGNLSWVVNVTGGEKSSFNRDSNPGPLAYHAHALTTELLGPDLSYCNFNNNPLA